MSVTHALILTQGREGLDYRKDFVGFADQGAGTGTQGALFGQPAGEGSQRQDRHGRVALAQSMDDFQSALIAQRNPHHQHVGVMLSGQLEQSFARIGLGHHLDVVLGQQLRHTSQKKGMLIRQ